MSRFALVCRLTRRCSRPPRNRAASCGRRWAASGEHQVVRPPALSWSRGEIPAPPRQLPYIHRRLQRSARLSATWHAANLTIRGVAPTEGVVKIMLMTNLKAAAARLLAVGALAIGGGLTVAPAGDQPAKGDKWKELAPKGGGFSVQVPGDAAEGNEAIEVKETKEGFSGKTYTVKQSGATFEVHYREYDDEWLKNWPIEQLLKDTKEQAIKDAIKRKGKVVLDKEIKEGEARGHALLLDRPEEKQSRASWYVVQNRLYRVSVEGPKKVVSGEDGDRFFKSFKLESK